MFLISNQETISTTRGALQSSLAAVAPERLLPSPLGLASPTQALLNKLKLLSCQLVAKQLIDS